MSFFAKVKQVLGIGGVKVELKVPGQASKEALAIDGTVMLTAKSDQHVLSVDVKLVEEWTTGRGEDKDTQEYELGTVTAATEFDLKAGEAREVPFHLTYELLKSDAEQLKDRGGALGAVGKLGMFADAEKSVYKVVADADVKGVALDPSDDKAIKLV